MDNAASLLRLSAILAAVMGLALAPASHAQTVPQNAQPKVDRTLVATHIKVSRGREPLNLTMLEDRLRDTKAINPWKKLELKGEIDDLLARFRQAHATGRSHVEQLRQPYEKLIASIQTMLQRDPALASDISYSKDAIWAVLADGSKFASLN
jgi:hypothetical protein